MILSLENKKGIFDKEILNFKLDPNSISSQKVENKIAEKISGFIGDDAQKFKQKYQMSLKDYIFTQKLWDQILNKNIIDDSSINDELYEVHFRLKEDKPLWMKLWDFLDLEEEDFDSLVREAKESIENEEIKHTGDILHTISMLVYFEEKKLIYFSMDLLLTTAIYQWKKLFNINERMKKIESFNFREASGSYGFFATEIPKFVKFMDEIFKAYEDKYNERNVERKIELLALIETDSLEFYQRLINDYYDYPILKYIDTNEFVDQLCSARHYNAMQVLYAISQRYKTMSFNKIYEKEELWFDDVIQVAEAKVDSMKRIRKFELKEKNSS